jgi:DNA-binding response OmpR family regulator
MTASRVLLVEDEDIIAAFIAHKLAGADIQLVRCADAESAWLQLESQGDSFGTILLDRQLPGMDGMTLLRKIKGNPALCDIPVVMETGADDANSISEGLAAGAYYYLTKPLQPKLLLTVVKAALADRRAFLEGQAAVRQAGKALAFLESGVFRCRTALDARDLAYGLARGFPDPERVVLGLQELLLNAVEHGNLGITYEEKTRLMLEGAWADEVERRLALPEFADRTVGVTFERNDAALSVTIVDNGPGFDWRKYMEFDPERAFDPHGRGIAMSRMMSFDSLEYRGTGNTVVVTVARPAN